MLKKGNKIYVAFLAISVPLLLFFLCSRMIFESGVNSKSENYQQTVSLTDYLIKLDNAAYNTDTQELKVTAYIKESNSTNGATYPEIYSIAADYDIETFMTYRTERNKYNEFGMDIIVENVSDEFRYIRIYWQSKAPDTVIPEKYDEFGNLIPSTTEEGEMQYVYMIIDKVDCQIINSEKEESKPPATSVLFDEENIKSEEVDVEDMPKVFTTTSRVTSSLAENTDKDDDKKSTAKSTKKSSKVTTKKQSDVQENEFNNNSEYNNNEQNYSENNNTDNTVIQTDNNENGSDVQEQITSTNTVTENHTTFHTTTTTKKVTKATSNITVKSTTKNTTRPTTKNTTHSTSKVIKKSTAKATTMATTKATSKTVTKPKQSIPLTRLYIKSENSDGIINLGLGEKTKVSAGYEPINSDATFTWSSNRVDRATVDSNGIITGVGAGSAIITCTSSDGLSASIMVTVS